MSTQTLPGRQQPTSEFILVDAAGSASVAGSLISTANSTTTPLGAGATFTGTAENVSGYADIRVSVFASHASAVDGLSAQQSIDGTNWDFTDVYSIPATTGKTFAFPVNSTFFRLVYTNGATLQTSFRLQTKFLAETNKASAVRPQDARPNDNDMEEVLSYRMTWNGTAWDRTVAPNQTIRMVSAAASVNATVVKASTGKLHKLVGYNAAAALRFLKIYNKATAPVVGTDTPVLTITLPPSAAFSLDFGNGGQHYTAGIGYGFTTAAADADASALTAADVIGFNVIYS